MIKKFFLLLILLFVSVQAQIIPNGDFENTYSDTMYFEPVGYSSGNWSSTSVFDYTMTKYGTVRPEKAGNNTVLQIETVWDFSSFLVYKITNQNLSAGNYTFSCDAQTISSKQDSGKIYLFFANGNSLVGGKTLRVPSSAQGMNNYSVSVTTVNTANTVYIGIEGGDSLGTIFKVDNLSLKDANNKAINIPNGDFESWKPIIRRMPENWVSSFPGIVYKEDSLIDASNNDTIPIPMASMSYAAAESEGAIAYSGQKSLKIVPAMVMTGENGSLGGAVLGGFGVDFSPGFYAVSTTDTLDSLVAYVNMNPGNTSQLNKDTVTIIVKLKNANKQQDFYKTVSLADLTANQFDKVVLDVSAFGEAPDSIAIGFYIGHYTTTDKFYSPGFPTIYVDNVRFYINGFAASIGDFIPYFSDIVLYESGGFLRIKNLPSSVNNASLYLYDLAGNLVYKTGITDKVSKPSIATGLYLYKVQGNNKVLKVGKIYLN